MLILSDLRVAIGGIPILNGISLSFPQAARIGIVGESGSGKTMLALSVIGLLPEGAEVTGEIHLGDDELVSKTDREMNRIRGRRITMTFQDSLSALDPLMTIGRQLALPLRRRGLRGDDIRQASISLLQDVQLDRPVGRLRAYPHQLSGGQRQRISLALALAGEPDVLIADEPTTALDVTVKAEVIKLMRRVIDRTDTTLILITHDLPLVAFACDRIIVMYGGHIVEDGPTKQILNEPRHQYTAALVMSMPSLRADDEPSPDLVSIPGSVPAAGDFPSGCPFRTRCGVATEVCEVMPDMTVDGDHSYACWHPVGASS